MGDRAAELRLRSAACVYVDELMIARDRREGVNSRLVNRHPVANADFLTYERVYVFLHLDSLIVTRNRGRNESTGIMPT